MTRGCRTSSLSAAISWILKAKAKTRSGMGVNASILGLTHYEELPVEILQLVVAEMRKPVDDGSSWPVLSKVCRDWRRAAGTCTQGCVCACAVG